MEDLPLDTCRLCGLNKCNLDLLSFSETSFDFFETTTKFFILDHSRNEVLPNRVCQDCVGVISNFVSYSENVTKVQQQLELEILQRDLMPSIKIEYLEEPDTHENDIDYIPEDFVPDVVVPKVHGTRKRTRDQDAPTSVTTRSGKSVKSEKSPEIQKKIPKTPRARERRGRQAAIKAPRQKRIRRKRDEIIDDDTDDELRRQFPMKNEPDDEFSQSVSEGTNEKDQVSFYQIT